MLFQKGCIYNLESAAAGVILGGILGGGATAITTIYKWSSDADQILKRAVSNPLETAFGFCHIQDGYNIPPASEEVNLQERKTENLYNYTIIKEKLNFLCRVLIRYQGKTALY